MTILDDIIAYKKEEVAAAKRSKSFEELIAETKSAPPVRNFSEALSDKAKTDFAIIAEIKKASPSKGLIRPDFSPEAHAGEYERGGAACLSVLTDTPSFQGSPEYLRLARASCNLPVLRKDFMIDPYQVVEARAWGADCILIIMACTSDALAAELAAASRENGIDFLVETHTEAEMERAANLNPALIGVNNRNLNTFETDIEITIELAKLAPATALLVSESGISTNDDLEYLSARGAGAFLIGEQLMRQPDLETATRQLISGQK